MPRADDVRTMFDRIAGRYDLLNRVMTLGIDKRWRRAAVRSCNVGPKTEALDVCCGTGDLSFLLAKAGAKRVVGLDFSPKMLEQAQARAAAAAPPAHDVEFVEGDAMSLPFADDSFDVITVGFGVRNVEQLSTALEEFVRVLRPGGTLACLEITRPTSRLGSIFHKIWFHRVIPFVGGIISGDREAYSYLPQSTLNFPRPPQLKAMLATAGFGDVSWRTFGGGIVALHTAHVSGSSGMDESTADGSRQQEPVS